MTTNGGRLVDMPAAEPRYCIAQVSEEARDAWRRFCDTQGVDRTALAEAIGSWMAEHDTLPPLLDEWVTAARDLRNQRRRRD